MRVVICLFVFAQSDRERSPVAKKIRLFIRSQNFSSHLTVRLPVRLYHRESNVNCHSLWLVWSLQPDIAHICCGELTAVKTGHPLIEFTDTDQYHMTMTWA